MSLQTIKLELIKRISDIGSEKLLERLRQFLREAEMEDPLIHPNALSKEETHLLSAINQAFPPAMQKALDDLHSKQKQVGLSESEQEELLRLTDNLEDLEAKRLENMLQLAKLWDMSLDQLRDRLGIAAPEPYVW